MQPVDYTGYAREMYERWGRLLRDEADIYKMEFKVDIFNKGFDYTIRKKDDGLSDTELFMENSTNNARRKSKSLRPITMEQFFDRFQLDAYKAIYAVAPRKHSPALLKEYNATIITSQIAMIDLDFARYKEEIALLCFEKTSDSVRAKLEMPKFPSLHSEDWHEGNWRMTNPIC